MTTITDYVKAHLDDTIESEAYQVGQRADDNISILMAVSIAVSLKRIADILETRSIHEPPV